MSTLKSILAELKARGFVVKRCSSTINGKPLFTVEGLVGYFSKNGLEDLL